MRPKHALAPTAAVLLALLLLPWGNSPAWAHAHLVSAEPPVDSTVSAAPAAVTITFTEGVEPRFSGIEVTAAGGANVDQGDAHLAGDNRHLAVGLKPLPPGTYTVHWHATAVDTHKTDGTFRFTVGQPASGR